MAVTRAQREQILPEIAGYRLIRVLGKGGMSIVYLAQQLSLGREVAIKVMLSEALADETGRRRFENEARTIARLDHPNIVRIHEVGRTADGLPYYVMPVLRRSNVGKRNLALDESKVRNVLEALLAALGYAHSRGVIHRDVKAENVLFDQADRTMLTDFGIALRRGYGSRMTTTGVAVGSTAYMAPEQARGAEVDLRADLYSLGVLAWEMLNGSLPYQADDGLSMALKHVQDPIPRLPPHLAHWQRFFERALAKVPIERYPDAPSMLEAMHQVPHAQRQPLRAAIARMRSKFGVKQLIWIGTVVSAIAAAIVLIPSNGEKTRSFLPTPATRAAESTTSTTATTGMDSTLGAPVPDPGDALLRAAPESAAQPFVSAALGQLQQHRLTAPSGNCAYDNVMAAWRTDPSHVALPELTYRLVKAISTDAVQDARKGDDNAAKDAISRAERLSERDRDRNAGVLLDMRKDLVTALSTRMSTARENYDRAGAKRVLVSAKALGVPQQQIAILQGQIGKIAQPGDRISTQSGEMTLTLADGKMLAISRTPVSRDSYADFAKSTQRTAALCRERASPLRILAPKTWEAPGFEQPVTSAVVCISWQDAEAFARWQSQRSKHRYRLPNASEAQAVASTNSGKSVAEWVNDCVAGGNCNRRMTAGRSWRSNTGTGRALEAQRGYDDVGFRLVREL